MKKFTTFQEICKLTTPHHLFLSNIKNKVFDESEFFSRGLSYEEYNPDFVSFIVKIARVNPVFENLCRKKEYDVLWEKQYYSIGYVLSSDQPKRVNLLPFKEGNFDLLRGAYFFHQAQLIRKELKQDFSYDEMLFLEEAKKYNSIHAIQQYNYYIYSEIEKGDMDKEEALSLSGKAIKNCKNQLHSYGSYAYMMLAEAYFRRAQLLMHHQDREQAKIALSAGITACKFATKYLKSSEKNIHNASLGQGLQYSNSLKLEVPLEAEQLLKDLQEKIDSESHTESISLRQKF